MVGQPRIIEGLGEILVACVANERHYPLGLTLLPTVAKCGRKQCSSGCSPKNTLGLQQLAGGSEGFTVTDRVGSLRPREVTYRGYLFLSYALNEVTASCSELSRLYVTGQG
jgi:hypothetical protein